MLLLASVFETFHTECLQPQSYRLDSVHFVIAFSLSFSTILLKNLKAEVVIENISSANVSYNGFMMVKKGIHGGICQVFHPYAQGNYLTMEEAEFVPKNLAQLSKEHHILYIDSNNLYGTAMCELMPLDSF